LKIVINDQAANWYKEEMGLNTGDYVRFFARYGGHSTVQQGFSLGISNEEPLDAGISTTKDGITYYIEQKDLWYFDNHHLYVEFNEKAKEPEFKYEK
jgi:uncharacterized protein YneR